MGACHPLLRRFNHTDRLRELGFGDISGATLEDLVERLKALADEKKVISDADVQVGVRCSCRTIRLRGRFDATAPRATPVSLPPPDTSYLPVACLLGHRSARRRLVAA